jgi:hypothetical protein
MKEIRIKHGHSKRCCIVGTDNEYYFAKRFFYGTFAANEGKKRGGYRWIEVMCNDPNCRFYAAVLGDRVSQIIYDFIAPRDM